MIYPLLLLSATAYGIGEIGECYYCTGSGERFDFYASSTIIAGDIIEGKWAFTHQSMLPLGQNPSRL